MASRTQVDHQPKRVVAESAFEMLLTEVLRASAKSDPKEHLIIDPAGDSAVHASLEAQGYDVGYRFIERILQHKVIATDHLEIMKFICKEFWHEVFGKHIDKLQTNHRGVFVLKDSSFRWMTRFSSSQEEVVQAAILHLLQFPCGVLRGALANLGVTASVSAENVSPPTCSFNIRISQPEAAAST